MTRAELRAELRARLDDTLEPYRHDTPTLNAWLDAAQIEAVERSRLLVDSTTPGVASLALLVGVDSYALDARVLFVQRARLEGRCRDLAAVSEAERLRYFGNRWDGEPRRYGTDLDTHEITLDYAPDAETVLLDEIDITAASWAADVLTLTAPGHDARATDAVTLAGFAAGTYTVESRAGDDILIALTDDPGAFVSGTLQRHRRLEMTVSRLPLTGLEDDDSEPEIPLRYQRDLFDWCAHLAYLSRDADAESSPRAQLFENRFTARFGPRLSARDYARLSRNPVTPCRIPRGGL